MTHRLVVPSAFVELLLAEHTTATLLSMRLGLEHIVVNRQHIVSFGQLHRGKGQGRGRGVIVLDDLLDNVQSELADTGAAKLLYDPIAMHGSGGRTVCFERSHGQRFQGPNTKDGRQKITTCKERELEEGKAKAEEWAGCGVLFSFAVTQPANLRFSILPYGKYNDFFLPPPISARHRDVGGTPPINTTTNEHYEL